MKIINKYNDDWRGLVAIRLPFVAKTRPSGGLFAASMLPICRLHVANPLP
jgi:hypothetical protein